MDPTFQMHDLVIRFNPEDAKKAILEREPGEVSVASILRLHAFWEGQACIERCSFVPDETVERGQLMVSPKKKGE